MDYNVGQQANTNDAGVASTSGLKGSDIGCYKGYHHGLSQGRSCFWGPCENRLLHEANMTRGHDSTPIDIGGYYYRIIAGLRYGSHYGIRVSVSPGFRILLPGASICQVHS